MINLRRTWGQVLCTKGFPVFEVPTRISRMTVDSIQQKSLIFQMTVGNFANVCKWPGLWE